MFNRGIIFKCIFKQSIAKSLCKWLPEVIFQVLNYEKVRIKLFFQIGLHITKFLLQEKYDKIWNAATSKWMRAGLSTGIPILCSLINLNFRFLSRISFILM